MFKPLEQIVGFRRELRRSKLAGGDQLIWFHIFMEMNRARWPQTLRLTDEDLMNGLNAYEKTGAPASTEILRRGRARLKLKGFIDFKKVRAGQYEYEMKKLYPDETLPEAYRRPCAEPTGAAGQPKTRMRKDEDKKEDKKTEPWERYV